MADGAKQASAVRPLLAAWLGWCFDGLDGYLYVMVAGPFVARLVANEHGVELAALKASKELTGEAATKAAIIQAVFLVGWALGGAAFGRLGDRLGRSRTLTYTIVTYAIFTGLGFFATRWWHLLLFRFLAALGIGGEWAAGSALVSETLDRRHRAWASALLQSAYITGCIAAALTSGLFSDPKWVFLVGVLPALVTLWIRKAVPEPEEWERAAKDQPPPKVSALFAPGMARTTVLLLVFISLALTTVWAFLYYSPQLVKAMPEAAGWDDAKVQQVKVWVTVAYLGVNLVGNFFATYLARAVGYRWGFFVMTACALVSVLWGYRTPPTYQSIWLVTGLEAFFGLGLFAMFPLYVPTLFPTLLRTLGSGVVYNVGRLAAAGGTLATGWLTAQAGGPAQAVWFVGLLYAPMLVVCVLLPEPACDRKAG